MAADAGAPAGCDSGGVGGPEPAVGEMKITRYCKRGHPRPGSYLPGDNCAQCATIRQREYRARNPERARQAWRDWNAKQANSGYYREYYRTRRKTFEGRLYAVL